MFEAPWWAIFLNPHFLPRRALWDAMRNVSEHLRGRMLDVGCGVQPYRRLLTGAERITGLELDTEKNRREKTADTYYDGTTFPFEAASFDSVLCNQVLEHVFDADLFVGEIGRVLAPGGTLVLTVPFIWPEHEQPCDCQRYTSYGLKHLLRQAGLDVLEQRKLVTGGAALFALAADSLNVMAGPYPFPVRLVIRLLCCFPLSLLGALFGKMTKRDHELYLDNFVVARKWSATELAV
jgi:SAM-dependent methyltransferase